MPALIHWPGRRIGLLGGSFNPAHRAHLAISRAALARLGLDAVVWLVSPQNPLKPETGMAPFDERLAAARALAIDPRIHVSDAEARLGTRYTADTLARLCRHSPATRFVWLMGADNLIQLSSWKHWHKIFALVPVAVFARPSYSLRALSATAARCYAGARLAENKASGLAAKAAPAWVFLRTRLDATSASRIRQSIE